MERDWFWAIIHKRSFAQEEVGQSLLFCGLACRLFFSYAPPLENSGLPAKAIFMTDLCQDGRQFAPCAPAAAQVLTTCHETG